MERYAIYETSIGLLKIKYIDNTLIYLKKNDSIFDNYGNKTVFTDIVIKQINEYLEGNRQEFDINYKLYGTDFQKMVWNQLSKIPYGEKRTYKQIAELIGNKNAYRAVGMANNKNPINIIIPCHRVIGSNGSMVGYAGGLSLKEKLLNLEEENIFNYNCIS